MLAVQADGHDLRTVESLATATGELESSSSRLSKRPRSAMRLLHAGISHDAHRVPSRQPAAERHRNPRRAVSESLPLYRLPPHLRGGQACLPALGTLAPAFPGTKTRGSSPGARSSWMMCSFPACCTSHSSEVSMRTDESRALTPSAARQRPGVRAVYTADDLGDYLKPGPVLVAPPPIPGLVFHGCTQLPLAKDKVRHVGEPIAMVVADSRYVAEDALRDVIVDIDPLDAVVDLEKALQPEAALIHEHLTIQCRRSRRAAEGRLRSRLEGLPTSSSTGGLRTTAGCRRPSRIAQSPSSGMRARKSSRSGTPHRRRFPFATAWRKMLGLLESQVNVIAPFVGGGFGPKIMMFYPEELLVPWAAIRLNRPLKWTEDRQENFYATTQERGQVHDAEMALTRDGRIVGVRDVFLFDTGAYDPVRADDSDQQSMHAARPVRHPELRERVHGGLYEQNHRDAGARRGTPARGIRQRAAAGFSRAGARPRSCGNSKEESASIGQVSRKPRDHVSGFCAVDLRQRRLPARIGAGRPTDWLRDVRARGAAEAAGGKAGTSESVLPVTLRVLASDRTRGLA